MKKRNNKKLPKYWLGTRKPTSLGYQPNYGIGGTQFSSTPGEDINPEIKTVKSNIIPSALDKLQQHGTTAFNVLSNRTRPYSNIGTALSATNAINQSMANFGTSATSYLGGAGNLPSSVSNTISNINTIGANQGAQAAGRSALGTAGTVLGAVGTLYGLGDMANQWANQNEHRSIGEMRNTQAVNTYTTDMGNTYTQRGGVNAGAELDYARATKRAKQLNFGATSIGTGLAAGATIGAIAGSEVPVIGTLIGGAAGALIGGAAAALGFGDTEEEVQKQMDLIKDVTALENRQNKTVADSSDVYQGFYNRTKSGVASAAKGKLPKFAKGKVNAKVSNGEIQGNLNEGWAIQYGGIPNNDDKIKTHVDKTDYIISNPFVPYVKATGDVIGALTMQDMVNRNKKDYKSAPLKAKCGKLPGFKLGDFGEYAMTAVPNIAQILAATQQYNVDKHMPINTTPIHADYSAARNNAYKIAGLTPDMWPIYNAIDQQTANQRYNVMRMPGAGYGGRMVMLDSANTQAAKAKAEARYQAEIDRIKQETLGLQTAANINSHETDTNNKNEIVVRGMTQQANAAKYNALAQDRKNMVTPLGPLFRDMLDINKYHDSLDYGNKKLALIDRSLGIQEQALLNNWLNNIGGSTPSYKYNFPSLTTPTINAKLNPSRFSLMDTSTWPGYSTPQITIPSGMEWIANKYYANPNNFRFTYNPFKFGR